MVQMAIDLWQDKMFRVMLLSIFLFVLCPGNSLNLDKRYFLVFKQPILRKRIIFETFLFVFYQLFLLGTADSL